MDSKLKQTRIRLWQAGDMPGEGNEITNVKNIRQLIRALSGLQSWAYTHKPVLPGLGVSKRIANSNAKKIKECNDNGVVVNLSANNLSHADSLADLGIAPVTTVLPSNITKSMKTPSGRRVVVCPATIKKNTSCENCGGITALCARPDRDYIIGFPAHGFRKKKASGVASET